MNAEIEQLKLKLIEWVIRQETQDGLQSIVNQVDKVEKSKEDSTKLMGHRSNGVRVLKEQLVKSIQEALSQCESGKVKTLDELEAESEQW